MPLKLYNWDVWLKKRSFTLRRGDHYDCDQGSMSQQIRNAAVKRGLKVSVVEKGYDAIHVIVVYSSAPPKTKNKGGKK